MPITSDEAGEKYGPKAQESAMANPTTCECDGEAHVASRSTDGVRLVCCACGSETLISKPIEVKKSIIKRSREWLSDALTETDDGLGEGFDGDPEKDDLPALVTVAVCLLITCIILAVCLAPGVIK